MSWSQHVPKIFRIEFGWSLISAEFGSVSCSGGLVVEFRLWFLGRNQVPVKPPNPLAIQAQEPKTRVVPSGTALALLNSAIKFASELAEPPTWRSSCRCLVVKPAQGYP